MRPATLHTKMMRSQYVGLLMAGMSILTAFGKALLSRTAKFLSPESMSRTYVATWTPPSSTETSCAFVSTLHESDGSLFICCIRQRPILA